MRRLSGGRARNPLPEGAVVVGLGLVLGGLAQYGFLSVATHALGAARAAPLATFWGLLFIGGPGCFIPLEQETSRALASRRARALGGRPVVLRAAAAGALVSLALLIAVGAARGPIETRLFRGDPALVWALMAGLAAYCLEHLTRGTLAGNGRFSRYGLLLSSEGLLRVGLAAALALAGARAAGAFGGAMVAGSFAAVAVAIAGQRGLLRPGPPTPWAEISSAIGLLLVASVLTQFLLSVGTVAVQLLASPGEQAAASRFLSSRIVAYSPIFLFQAVQFTLLPKLSAYAGRARWAEFRRSLAQILGLVAAIGAAAVVGITVLGPWATRLLFGRGLELGSLDFLLLAVSCAVFLIAQTLSQALVALSGYPLVAYGWLLGAAVFVVLTVVGHGLFLRVEVGLVGAALASSLLMAALLVRALRARSAATVLEPAAAGLSRTVAKL